MGEVEVAVDTPLTDAQSFVRAVHTPIFASTDQWLAVVRSDDTEYWESLNSSLWCRLQRRSFPDAITKRPGRSAIIFSGYPRDERKKKLAGYRAGITVTNRV
jgi:hypothetical protein